MTRALWPDRRGATAMLVASALPFLLAATAAAVDAHQAKAISTTDGVTNMLGTLLQSTQVDVKLLGLGLGIGLPGEAQIVAKLLQAAPALETALFQLLSFAGLSIGTAHIRVNGKPVLMA